MTTLHSCERKKKINVRKRSEGAESFKSVCTKKNMCTACGNEQTTDGVEKHKIEV